MSTTKGISFIEFIVVIAVIAIISAITFLTLASQTTRRSAEGEALSILTLLDQARSLAMSSKENSDYGVYFATTTKTLFKGSSYDVNDPDNIVENVAAGIQIIHISLNGGGNSVVYDRLTGRSDNYGTIEIQSMSDSQATSSVTVYETGLNEASQ